MRQYKAFVKKEFLELYRSGKGWIMLAVFFLFGIMAPAFAKLTPFIMEAFST